MATATSMERKSYERELKAYSAYKMFSQTSGVGGVPGHGTVTVMYSLEFQRIIKTLATGGSITRNDEPRGTFTCTGPNGKNNGKVWSKTLNESILTGYVDINENGDHFLTDYFVECWHQGLVEPGVMKEYETVDH
tara:strand:- start:177 stop:581 length:405 start_codon:yes stop_codon:yes gene_type:complete